MSFISTTDEHIASGGTISGDLTIDADLSVTGSTAITTNEVIQGTSIIDITNTEALLVRKDSDGGDIFTIDTTNSAVKFGVDGTGADVTFYSDTAGDSFVWDASTEKLTITGTHGQTDLDVADGNLVVADNVDIEGDIDVNGTTNLNAVDIDGTFTQDAGNVVFNEDSGDYDFRIESNGNANMLYVDGGNDRIGVGAAPAEATFEVAGTSGEISKFGTLTNDWGANHAFGVTNGTGIMISDVSGANNTAANRVIALQRDDTNGHAIYIYDPAGNVDIALKGNSSSYVKGGSFGVGTDSPATKFQVVDTSNMKYENNQLTLTRVGSGHLLTLLNADTTISDNEALGYLRFEGNENGAGQVTGGSIEVHCEKDWSGNSDCPTRMTFWTTPDGSANATEKMRIDEAGVLTLTAGQINFPDTQNASADANTLDDYEEGTWTPAWTQGFSATNYNLQHGKYVKVGGMVSVFCSIGMTASGTTATSDPLRIELPFTAVSGMNNFVGTAVVQSGAALDTESAYIRCGTAGGADATAFFVGQADAADGQQAINGDDIGTGGLINFQITYQTT